MASFVVDSNFFIQAHRNNYPLDVATSFWLKVKDLATAGHIICIDKVKDEIYKNEDDLKGWCVGNLPSNFFHDTATILADYGRVCTWAVSKSSHYLQKALDEFLNAEEADAWLVSFALAKGIKVVTYETSNPAQKSRIKLPDACIPFSVPFTNTVGMFRELGITF
ncbi:DUF4411 family protein [Flaviaesturariibacter aridisoli]|uniref:DUF4411 family protein n=1 Tax=Flaviaesturariibacter aridisoli TaxID=2545761 RepID=A0A4V2WM82_9BACT|nr:DUF4411 family protein [Flaviaesturariibacter aridisoli]TCZ66429.1 DUF4411 family protein [Flaviaesturariibacter aridisoli]